MKIKLERGKRYSRKNNLVLEDGKPIIKLLQHFPVDIEEMDVNGKMYHEFYISNNPELVEWLVKNEKYKVEEEVVVLKKRGRPRKN